MTSTTTRRIAISLAGLTAVAGLAACGTTPVATSSVGAPEKPAVGATVNDKGTFVRNVATAVREQSSVHIEAQAPDVLSSKADSGSATTGSEVISLAGDVALTGAERARFTVHMPDSADIKGDLELRLVDGVAYVKGGDLTSGKFMKLDPKEVEGDRASMWGGADMRDFFTSDRVNAMVDALGKDVKSVTYRGDEQVDGRSCARYTVVSGTTHLQAEGERQAKALEKEMAKAGRSKPGGWKSDDSDSRMWQKEHQRELKRERTNAPTTFTGDLWLDNASLPCKVETHAEGRTMTLLTSKWDEPVKVEVPAAGDITTTPDLKQMMRGGMHPDDSGSSTSGATSSGY